MIEIRYKNTTEFPGVDTNLWVDIGEDTTCTHAFEAFVKVLQLAGYQQESIRHSAECVESDMREHIEAATSVMNKRVGDSDGM